MSNSLSARYRGRSIPEKSDEWTVDSVAYRAVHTGDTETCAHTGETIPPQTGHFYVTARGKTGREYDEFEHYALKDEQALTEWLGE